MEKVDDLEMYDLIKAAYPDKFPDREGEDDWDEIMDFIANGLRHPNDDQYEALTDFVSRLVMLTNPVYSPLSTKAYHALGTVTQFKKPEGGVLFNIEAAVKREVQGSNT